MIWDWDGGGEGGSGGPSNDKAMVMRGAGPREVRGGEGREVNKGAPFQGW